MYWKNIEFNQSPIFIIGFPRSGTTFLQSILATQDIVTFPESHFYTRLWQQLSVDGNRLIKDKKNSEIVFSHLDNKFDLQLNQDEQTFLEGFLSSNQVSDKELFENILKIYISKNQFDFSPEKVWLEKTPGHSKHIQRLSKLYPKARFIAMVRHPFNTVESAAQKLKMTTDNKYIIAKRWGKTYRKLFQFKKQFPNKLFIVKYESLLAEKEIETERIMEFLQLPFNLHRLGEYVDYAKQLKTKTETWKNNNSKTQFQDSKTTISQNEKKLIQFPNKDVMRAFQYSTVKSNLLDYVRLSLRYPIEHLQFILKRRGIG